LSGVAHEAVTVRDLRIVYSSGRQATLAVDGATLSVGEGEFVALVGPSGCGKSTILKVVAGLLAANGGTVLVGDEPVNGVPEGVGMVFQNDALLPWKTVRDNVRLPLALRGLATRAQDAEIVRLLDLVRLTGFEDFYPRALSGGMRKRVALARTLAYDPRLFLMDEPFGPLDAQTRILIGREFLAIWERLGKSVLFVTHDVEEAIALADRVLVMSPRPGRIVAEFRVGLPRPRDYEEVRFAGEFVALQRSIWHALTDHAALRGAAS
jgi:NitT/TauT family transport system ATP-binding protein